MGRVLLCSYRCVIVTTTCSYHYPEALTPYYCHTVLLLTESQVDGSRVATCYCLVCVFTVFLLLCYYY
jgi:hypothetical protein